MDTHLTQKLLNRVSQRSCTIVHSHQQSMRVTVVLHLQQYLALSTFNFSHSDDWLVVFYFYLNFCFSDYRLLMISITFSYAYWPFVYLLWSAWFFFLIWSFKKLLVFRSYLYTLDWSPLPDSPLHCEYSLPVCAWCICYPSMQRLRNVVSTYWEEWLFFYPKSSIHHFPP